MLRRIRVCAALLLLFLGAVLISYPALNGRRLESNASAAVDRFEQYRPSATISPLSPEDRPAETVSPLPYEELLLSMRQYNEHLYIQKQFKLASSAAYEEAAINLSEYGIEDGVAGVMRIPSIELEMPIYLGASYENMAAGAVVLGQTSLPVGGENTNCVIAGHRGWNGAAYFLYLNRIKAGDAVSITNLWETLEYTVVESKIIEPDAIEEILIQPGKDLLTLMTCDPPNTNGRYRLIVICERRDTNEG